MIPTGKKFYKISIAISSKKEVAIKENIFETISNDRPGFYKRSVKIRNLKTKVTSFEDPRKIISDYAYLETHRIAAYEEMDEKFSRKRMLQELKEKITEIRGEDVFRESVSFEKLKNVFKETVKDDKLAFEILNFIPEKNATDFIKYKVSENVKQEYLLETFKEDPEIFKIMSCIYGKIEKELLAPNLKAYGKLLIKTKTNKSGDYVVNPDVFVTDKGFEFSFDETYISAKYERGGYTHIEFEMSNPSEEKTGMIDDLLFWEKLEQNFNGEMQKVNLFKNDENLYSIESLEIYTEGLVKEKIKLI